MARTDTPIERVVVVYDSDFDIKHVYGIFTSPVEADIVENHAKIEAMEKGWGTQQARIMRVFDRGQS